MLRGRAGPVGAVPEYSRAVRVIAGVYGGRELVAPRGQSTRPTSDRVREALFSILSSVTGARVLDLFAGSGALAIEALSRGASQATLVDSSMAAVTAIQRNLASLQVEAEVRRQTASRFLHGARAAARQYDLVFLDPPYRHVSTLGRELSRALVPVLAADARVVAESDRRSPLGLELELLDERRYGDTLIQIHGTQ
jgi:16S rRNA (guanine966-N2)-methyltransferase